MGNYIAALVALFLIILACAIWQNGIAQKNEDRRNSRMIAGIVTMGAAMVMSMMVGRF